MTRSRSINSEAGEKAAEMVAMYRRLATMDPPVLRSLAIDLQRLSDESSASAALQPTPALQAKAQRDAQRAAAARSALVPIETER